MDEIINEKVKEFEALVADGWSVVYAKKASGLARWVNRFPRKLKRNEIYTRVCREYLERLHAAKKSRYE